jgi:hypothetical protein
MFNDIENPLLLYYSLTIFECTICHPGGWIFQKAGFPCLTGWDIPQAIDASRVIPDACASGMTF